MLNVYWCLLRIIFVVLKTSIVNIKIYIVLLTVIDTLLMRGGNKNKDHRFEQSDIKFILLF